MRFPQVSEKVKEAPANALRSVFASIGQVLLVTDRMKKKSAEADEAPGSGPDAENGTSAAPKATEAAPTATVPAPAEPADVQSEATAPAEAGGAAGTTGAPGAGGAAGAGGTAAAGETAAAGGTSVTAGASAAAGAQASAAPAEAAVTEAAVTESAAPEAPAKKPAAHKPAARKPAGTATGNVRVLGDEEARTTPVTARKPRPRKPTTATTTATTTPAETPAPAAAPPAEPEVVAAPEGPVSTGEAPLPNYDALTVASLRARLRNLSVDQVRALISYEQAHANRAEVIAMFERRVAKLEAPES